MENFPAAGKEDDKFELPPGFRFHPTDEELITQYLSKKVLDTTFCAIAIGEIDLKKCEPWDLPRRAKMGEKEWFFFCVRDRKYPTGLRTNRATDAGYWKATGKDKEIFKAKALIGMKKTLVFYKGRAPKGEKTNWVMHEYRLEGELSKHNLPTPPKNEWVICRVFQKVSGERRMQIPADSSSSLLPPLMDASPYNNNSYGTPSQIEFGESSHVTCFSDPNQMEDQKAQDDIVESLETPILASSSCSIQTLNSQYPDSFLGQDQFITRMLMENQGSTPSTKPNQKAEFFGERDFDADIYSLIYNNNNNNNNGNMVQRSFENQAIYSSAPAGPVDIGSLWNY